VHKLMEEFLTRELDGDEGGAPAAYFSSRSCSRMNLCTSCSAFKWQFWLVSLVPKHSFDEAISYESTGGLCSAR
jgi:hypothetical protein